MNLYQAIDHFREIYRHSGLKEARQAPLDEGIHKDFVNSLEQLTLVAEVIGIEQDRLRRNVEDMNIARAQ